MAGRLVWAYHRIPPGLCLLSSRRTINLGSWLVPAGRLLITLLLLSANPLLVPFILWLQV